MNGWLVANWGLSATILSGFVLWALLTIASRALALLKELREFRTELRLAMTQGPSVNGGNYLQSIYEELGALSFTVSEIQRRQQSGPWEPSEPH